MQANLLWLIPAFPLLGFLVNGLLAASTGRSEHGPDRGMVSFIAVLAPSLSFALTLWCATALGDGGALSQTLWQWISAGSFDISVGFQFDRLTAVMLSFVTGVGALIHVYSIGYMGRDRGYARFMSYLNLFMFSMIVLVLADSLPLLFLGWEGVGLCSYLLIGFWHKDLSNCDAARKAFIMNRIGDLGLLLGMFALYQIMGGEASLRFADISEWFRAALHSDILRTGAAAGLLTAATLLIFLGCTGKSAQIPLLTWLPDAMAGPTPVSALIHAATMVTSGIYLLARLSDVFVLAPDTLQVIAWIGIATSLYAAAVAMVQTDIKKVLAYSTVSQLGLMFMAAGCGAFDVALFHVFTHAFFKANLFLGSGSVIHALHGEQDMRRMGGLARFLPATYATFWAGWYAIIGLPLGAGFMSKDLILERVFATGGPVLYGLGLLVALGTAFYMTRMMVLTFWGQSRIEDKKRAAIHESGFAMQMPLWILALGSLAAGFLWFAAVPGLDLFARYLEPVVGPAQAVLGHHAEGAAHGPSPIVFAVAGALAAILGAGAAWAVGRAGRFDTASRGPLRGLAAAITVLLDAVYDILVVLPFRGLALLLDRVVNSLVIATIVSIAGGVVNELASASLLLQRPRLRAHLALGALGAVAVLAFLLWGLIP